VVSPGLDEPFAPTGAAGDNRVIVFLHPPGPHRRPFTALSTLTLALGLILSVVPLSSQGAASRVIAIGDIHGAYDEFTTILKRAGLVNDDLRWIGGATTVVQTGDFTDRGTDTRKVMDLLMRLEREAPRGRFKVLAGNHEIMNVIRDFRDVTPEICATFATPASDARREDGWRQYERIAQARARLTDPPPPAYTQTREAWLAAHPPGCLEYRDAMGPSGVYGKWLRGLDIATIVGDSLFMHAGLNPSRPAPRSIEALNAELRDEVKRIDAFHKRLVDRRYAAPFVDVNAMLGIAVAEIQAANAAIAAAKAATAQEPTLDIPLLREAQDIVGLAKWAVVDPEGPVWFRGYASWPEADTTAQVHGFLDGLKVARIVIGHTQAADRRMRTRYGGRVVMIDTGMLTSYYMGEPTALEIAGGSLKAIYRDREVDLTPNTAPRPMP
jgi:hypothetical protein